PVTLTATTADGTATSPDDYIGGTQTITVPPGQTTASVHVAVRGDVATEHDETFSVTLAGSGVTFARKSAVGTILDDDFGLCLTLRGLLPLRFCVTLPDPRTLKT